jgi:N-acetylglucosamine malate deacetylase 1
MAVLSRRSALKYASGFAALQALGLPLAAAPVQEFPRILVAGGHPDDPESGCGGTMIRYANLGCAITSLYLTRGEAGIPGKNAEEAARIRTAEVQQACRITGAKPLFFGQIDGNTEVNRQAYAWMQEILRQENPDIVLTHWPIDTHRDHRVIWQLVYDAWLQARQNRENRFSLLYFEVLTGDQTQHFRPTHYVGISEVLDRKKEACYAHQSQKPDTWYPHHLKMSEFRGLESQLGHAEAFVQQDLPGDFAF